MSDTDFSTTPFVAGSVIGLRTFRVDPLGRLTGVVHKQVWRPGVNQATCEIILPAPVPTQRHFDHRGNLVITTDITKDTTGVVWTGSAHPPGVPQDRKRKGQEKQERAAAAHVTGGLNCKCGYYAYFDGGNDYMTSDPVTTGIGMMVVGPSGYSYETDEAPRISGIIEGWGTVTVGSRGFRASQARVLALVVPPQPKTRLAVLAPRVLRNYPDVPVFEHEADALAAFPLTDSTFGSPEDEDFWTRKV